MKKILLFFVLLVSIFFYRSVIAGEIPMPGDHIVGVYHPWLDYSWPGFPTGVPVKNPLLADVPSLFYPLKIYSMKLFGSGQFPVWNSLIFNGYPLLATFQSGILNPFNIFFLMFSAPVAWTLYIAAQPLLALIFSYFFLRVLKLNKTSSVFGAVIYAFCGFNLLWLEYGIHGYVAAFIPLLFLLVLRRKYWHMSLFLAAQIFSGYPQITMYTIIFLGLWALYVERGKNWFGIGLKYSAAILLGMSVSAMLLLPGAELFHQSQRLGEPVSGGDKGAFYNWGQLITLIAPDFFGNPSTYNTWGDMYYYNNTGYASIVGLAIAIIGFTLSRNRLRYFFAPLYVFTVFLSLPSPVSFMLQKLPLFSASVLTRIMVFSGFSVSVLAALGLHSLLTRRFSLKSIRWMTMPGVLLAAYGLAVVYWYVNQTGFNTDLMVGLRNLFFPSIFLLMTCISVVLLWRFPSRKIYISLFIILLVTSELFRFGWKYNPFFKADLIFPSTPLFEYLKSRPEFRIDGGDVLPLSVWMAYGLQSSSGYDAVYPGTWAQYLSAIDTGSISNSKGRLGDIWSYDSKLFDYTGTGLVLALNRAPDGKALTDGTPFPKFQLPKFRQVFSDKSVAVLQNTHALTRYSLKTGYELIEAPAQIISRMQSDAFPLTSKVILSQNPDMEFRDSTTSEMTLISEKPTHIRFLVSGNGPVILLNTNSFYPGWKGRIDGQLVPVYKTNFAFQSIAVPAGDHIVEFTYQPLSTTIGCIISVLSVMIFLKLVTQKNAFPTTNTSSGSPS